jgi:hypothetical protein
MDHHPYHVTVFDLFHRHEPGWAWVAGTFATADDAMSDVKGRIERDLAYFWSEICRQQESPPTLHALVSHYETFAEMPVAFDADGNMIFDGTAYMKARAARIVAEAPAR